MILLCSHEFLASSGVLALAQGMVGKWDIEYIKQNQQREYSTLSIWMNGTTEDVNAGMSQKSQLNVSQGIYGRFFPIAAGWLHLPKLATGGFGFLRVNPKIANIEMHTFSSTGQWLYRKKLDNYVCQAKGRLKGLFCCII